MTNLMHHVRKLSMYFVACDETSKSFEKDNIPN